MPDNAVILVVEDSPDDIVLMKRGFKQAQIQNPVVFVRTGEDAIAYLSGEGKFASHSKHPVPKVVLLDLMLPGMDGFEVLTWIRKQQGMRGMPVIVLTSSNLMRDVNRAYQLGANSFFLKDVDFQNASQIFALLKHYWLETAITPESHRDPRRHPGSD